MGTFTLELEVGNPGHEEFVAAQAMVNTGAIYTTLPEDLLDRLGVACLESDIFEMADDSLVEYAKGSATVRLYGRTLPVPVGFACSDNTPLLGATTLEIFRLVADPVNEQLVPAPRIRARFF